MSNELRRTIRCCSNFSDVDVASRTAVIIREAVASIRVLHHTEYPSTSIRQQSSVAFRTGTVETVKCRLGVCGLPTLASIFRLHQMRTIAIDNSKPLSVSQFLSQSVCL